MNTYIRLLMFGWYPWIIGNIDDDNFDKESIFGGDESVLVRVTLENLKAVSHTRPFDFTELTGDIVDIERIDG